MSVAFYIENSYKVSELITKKYSTSFSLATSVLEKEKRKAIYAIYGFVRLADEIVDSLHNYDKSFLLEKLTEDLEYALKYGISTNLILASFVDTAKKYRIKKEHIDAFMQSMEYDLTKINYTETSDLNNYIYGSADVVGLMCLTVFCGGNQTLYDELEYPAQKLGSAFQKVNFIRDLREDTGDLGRNYFPEISVDKFSKETKSLIEKSIQQDFDEAFTGIKRLPGRSKLAVALAYYYYLSLFNKIKRASPEKILSMRVRISNFIKYLIIIRVGILYKLKFI